MEISQEVVQALIEAFDRSDWQEMTLTVGSDQLHISRSAPDGPAPAPPPPRPASAAPAAPEGSSPVAAEPPVAPAGSGGPLPPGTVIESPSVGLFWRAPSPGAPPFVEVDARVAEGDTLAIVEVMKLMNHVVAPVAGVVRAIVPENGAVVEYGQALIVIDRDG
jgi:acetyl-CoA carboxylase biotin carboxyl carrier protein